MPMFSSRSFIVSGLTFRSLKVLAALGSHCFAQAFSSCGEQGLLVIAVLILLIAVASLAVEQRL